jgi:hypothetical protein
LHLISPSEIEAKDNNNTQRSASYRNLYHDNRGRLKSKLYDKRDDFTFPIFTFPFIGSNILAAPAVGA